MIELPHVSVTPTDEQREIARTSELYPKGDMILVWINESDLWPLPAVLEKREPLLSKTGMLVAYFLGAFGLMLSQVGLGVIIYDPKLAAWGLLMVIDGLLLAFLCWSSVHLQPYDLPPEEKQDASEV